MEDQIAAQLFIKEKKGDIQLLLLETLNIVAQANLSKVIDIYKKILNNEIIVANVTTSLELKKEQKLNIENYIKQQFNSIPSIFVYQIDEQIKKGIQIFVGDNQINFPSLNINN